jgi:hypothetical protein
MKTINFNSYNWSRASNERPLENVIREGADVDISSAYGNSMLDKGLPYGRPYLPPKS